MSRKMIVLALTAAALAPTPAQAYYILHIPPDNLNLIMCGNGNVFPWIADGPDAQNIMHGIAIGLCQGTIIPNVDFDAGTVDVPRLMREQKPRQVKEPKPVGGARPAPGSEVKIPLR